MNILVTGGSGLVGSELCKVLAERNHNVAILSRKKQNLPCKVYIWDVQKKYIEEEAIEYSDCVIHLAGTNIGESKWTAQQKELILKSRVDSSNLIFEKAKQLKKTFNCVVSASAIGCYGAITSNHIFRELDPYGNDFLGNVCKTWEESVSKFEQLGSRVAKLRTSLVLSKNGGALQKIIKPVKLGIASALGSGNQYMPFIHIEDLVNIYVMAVEETFMQGAYNCASIDQKTNGEFVKTLCEVLHKPFWPFNVPKFALKAIYGEMADILLEGSRVDISKILSTGFRLKYNTLKEALLACI